MNILIIEDDPSLGKRISDIFYNTVTLNRVSLVHSFEEFMKEYLSLSLYDIVLTDLNLWSYEKPEWFEVIKKIREINTVIPIIVISGFDDIDTLRYGFSLGISDYIMKPIRLKELEIRVLNWLHSCYSSTIRCTWKIFNYMELTYDIDKNKFYFKGELIPLSRNNKHILSLFFAQPEKVLSEKYLWEKIWGDTYFSGKRNIRVNIMRLRKKLSMYQIDTWIENIHSEWYIFISNTYSSIYQKL